MAISSRSLPYFMYPSCSSVKGGFGFALEHDAKVIVVLGFVFNEAKVGEFGSGGTSAPLFEPFVCKLLQPL